MRGAGGCRAPRHFVRVLLVLAMLGLCTVASASEEPEGWAYELASELMSPYCPGRTLSECPSPQADQLRTWIILQEASGRTRAEVEVELIGRFGDGIRSRPRAEGFGLMAYVLPVLIFVGGGLLVAVFLRRQTQGGPASQPPTAPAETLDPELERRIDEELAGQR